MKSVYRLYCHCLEGKQYSDIWRYWSSTLIHNQEQNNQVNMNASIASSEQVSTQVNYLYNEIIYLFFFSYRASLRKGSRQIKEGESLHELENCILLYMLIIRNLRVVLWILSWKCIYLSVLFLYLQKFWDNSSETLQGGPLKAIHEWDSSFMTAERLETEAGL